MPGHMLVMSFDNSSFSQINSTLDRFFEYALTLLQKKKNINFCYIGTASNDSTIEDLFFTSFISSKFYSHVNVSKLSLTAQLSAKQIEQHIRTQDILFIGGGNTKFMMDMWQKTGFDVLLNKLKEEDKLPIIAGLSAGGMFPFESSLRLIEDSPQEYAPILGYGWIDASVCPHASSEIQAICKFDQDNKHNRMTAFEIAISKGILPPGFAVPENCMLHFYDGKLVDAFTTVKDVSCLFVTPFRTTAIDTRLLERQTSNVLAQEELKKLHIQHDDSSEIHANRCTIM